MKKYLLKALSLLLILVLLCSSFACKGPEFHGQWYDKKNEKADQSYLFGMCTIFDQVSWDNPDFPWDIGLEVCKNMGVKSIRNWLHFHQVMTDKDTVNELVAQKYHDLFAKEKEYGIQIIGMCHTSFQPQGYPNSINSCSKPTRDLTDGSVYMKWLEDYEQSWFTLVSEFPEVEYWEIDNESNNELFMPRLEGGSFTMARQQAEIFTDMLFFASRGIHRANPNAITVMGGIIPGNAPSFFNLMYDCIEAVGSWSPYPDDYFQVAAWHPYSNTFNAKDPKQWTEQQKKIYAVIKEREGKDKKVFFTELGWEGSVVGEQNAEANVEAVYREIQKELPFVEAAHYFSMFDRVEANGDFGLFNDPNRLHPVNTSYVAGAPKNRAYVFQRLAGGSGDLTLMQEWSKDTATPLK